jgi:hypothetical protein
MYHSVDAGGYALSLVPTTVVPVDIREIHPAFDIREGLDDGSRRHWTEFRRTLPMRKGNESMISWGEDELGLDDTTEREGNELAEFENDLW